MLSSHNDDMTRESRFCNVTLTLDGRSVAARTYLLPDLVSHNECLYSWPCGVAYGAQLSTYTGRKGGGLVLAYY